MMLLFTTIYFLFVYEASKILIYKIFEVSKLYEKIMLLSVILLFPYVIILITFSSNILEIFKNRTLEEYKNQTKDTYSDEEII